MKESIRLGATGDCTKDAIEKMQQELITMANEAARENGLEEYRLVMDVYKNSYTGGYTIVWRMRPFSVEEEYRKGSAQLRDMKRACFQYSCYKCKHQKQTEEEMEVCRQVEACEHCRAACPCRSCEEGSNWEWEGEEGVGRCDGVSADRSCCGAGDTAAGSGSAHSAGIPSMKKCRR